MLRKEAKERRLKITIHNTLIILHVAVNMETIQPTVIKGKKCVWLSH